VESHIGFLRLATNMSDAVPAMMSSSAITNLHPELANSSTSLEMAALGRIRSQQRKATENGLVERNEKSSDASNSPESSGSSGPALPRVARTATGRSRTEDIQLVRTRSEGIERVRGGTQSVTETALQLSMTKKVLIGTSTMMTNFVSVRRSHLLTVY